jgi:hypothetical protein
MLSGHVVDDVLISALSLLIAVDDYLGHVEYSRAYLTGLDAVIEVRGGYNQLGSSIPAMRNDVQVSTLIVRSLLLVHAIDAEPPLYTQTMDPPLSLHIPPDLPWGFIALIQRGRLSHSSVEMLHSFSGWQNKQGGPRPKHSPHLALPRASRETYPH